MSEGRSLGERLAELNQEIARLPQPFRWWQQRKMRRTVARIAARRDAQLRREGWIR